MQNVLSGDKSLGKVIAPPIGYSLTYESLGTTAGGFPGFDEKTWEIIKYSLGTGAGAVSDLLTTQVDSSATIFNRPGVDRAVSILSRELHRVELGRSSMSGLNEPLSNFDPYILSYFNRTYDELNYLKAKALAVTFTPSPALPATITSANAVTLEPAIVSMVASADAAFYFGVRKTIFIAPRIYTLLQTTKYGLTGSTESVLDVLTRILAQMNTIIVAGTPIMHVSPTVSDILLVVEPALLAVRGLPGFFDSEYYDWPSDTSYRRYGFTTSAFFKNSETTTQASMAIALLSVTTA